MAACEYLIHYPHGCLEQTTSSVFPQLYLPALIKLDQNQRLRGGEQHPRRASRACAACSTRAAASPTGRASGTRIGELDWRNDWGTTYAGPLLARGREGGLHAARRHEVLVAALPEGARAALESANSYDGRASMRADARRCRALRAGVSAVHAGAGRSARDRRDEPPARNSVAVARRNAGCWPRRTSSPASPTWRRRWSQQDRLQAFVFADAESLHLRLAAARSRRGAAWA